MIFLLANGALVLSSSASTPTSISAPSSPTPHGSGARSASSSSAPAFGASPRRRSGLYPVGRRHGFRDEVRRLCNPLTQKHLVRQETRMESPSMRSGFDFRVDRVVACLQPPIDELFHVRGRLEHRAPPGWPRSRHRRRGRGGRVLLQVWHELPHPRTVIDDPEGAVVPGNASALIGSAARSTGWPTTSISAPSSPTPHGCGARSASSSSAPASAASPRSSTPRPSSSGPPPKPADPHSGDPMNLTHDAMLVSLRLVRQALRPPGANRSLSITTPTPVPGATTSASCPNRPSPRWPRP